MIHTMEFCSCVKPFEELCSHLVHQVNNISHSLAFKLHGIHQNHRALHIQVPAHIQKTTRPGTLYSDDFLCQACATCELLSPHAVSMFVLKVNLCCADQEPAAWLRDKWRPRTNERQADFFY